MCFQLKIWQKSEQSKKWDFNRHDGIWCGTSSALITAHWESSVRLSDVVFASVSVLYVYKNIDGWATSWKRHEKATHQHAGLVAVNAPPSCIYTVSLCYFLMVLIRGSWMNDIKNLEQIFKNIFPSPVSLCKTYLIKHKITIVNQSILQRCSNFLWL